MAPGNRSFDPEVAALLRAAQEELTHLIGVARWDFYSAFRLGMSRVTQVDAFFIAFFHGVDRVLYSYLYDDGSDLDNVPGSINIVPGGPNDWVLRNGKTYYLAIDNGASHRNTTKFGNKAKISRDVLVTPLLRDSEVFGVASIQSYTPGTYAAEQIAAFEWLSGVVARLLVRQEEDRSMSESLGDVGAVAPDAVIEAVVRHVGDLRRTLDDALARTDANVTDYVQIVERISVDCARLQADTAELVLDAHRAADATFRSLTQRQREVAYLLVEGLSNAAIATRLGVADSTVKVHVAAILAKCGAHQRSQVVADLRPYLRGQAQRSHQKD